MKKKKSVKSAILWFTMLCMLFAMNFQVNVYASEDATPDVAKAREGVIQIRLYYVDKSGNEIILQTGSGFLVGASTGATTVITNYHVVNLSEEDKDTCSQLFGVDFHNANEVTYKIKAAVKRDVEVEATPKNGSEKADFAILELAQAIYDRAPLKLADSENVVETQNVYALGFPGATSAAQDDQVYTSSDVTITNGIVGKHQDVNSIAYILHNAGLGHGNSGGPLVDSNGAVIGVNTMYTDADSANTYYYSIAINEITEVLDALGFTYEKAGVPLAQESNNNSQSVNPIEGGEDNTRLESTERETEKPALAPEPDPIPAPEPEPEPESTDGPNMLLIGGIVGGVAIFIIIIILVIVMSKSKNKKQNAAAMGMGSAAQPSRPGPNAANIPHRPNLQNQPFTQGTVPVDTGAGETSVLGGGAGETSVLGGGSMQPAATLIRRKNGETARIAKPSFSIGKQRQKVDFCIPDNNSVSRVHAVITCKGGMYYISDQNSTNYTYVNGNKVNPNQEVKLNSGDKIRLADDEFEFRL